MYYCFHVTATSISFLVPNPLLTPSLFNIAHGVHLSLSLHNLSWDEGTLPLQGDEDNRVSVLIEVVVLGGLSLRRNVGRLLNRWGCVWVERPCCKTSQQDATQGHCSAVILIRTDNVISLPLSSIKYLSGVQNWMSPPEDMQLIFERLKERESVDTFF